MHRSTQTLFVLFAMVVVTLPVAVTAQETTAETTTTTTTTAPPHTLPFFEQFEVEQWHDDWIDWRYDDDRNTQITRGYQDNGLRVNIPPNERRGTGPFWKLPEDVEQAWFRYRIRFDDFYPITSGKLPGFAAMPNFTARGCNPSTETYPGWSARMLFEPSGFGGLEDGLIQVGYYTYHLDQAGTCGDFMLWDDGGVLGQDQWYCIEGRVQLNTPGSSDGVLEGWVDNELAFRQDGLAFRRPSEDWLDVRTFWLNVYFGGATIPNDRDLTLRIDDLAVSDTGRLGCPNRFRDDDGNQHEANIEWMFQREYVYGCDSELYCPTDKLSRAATAALLDRILDPPATTVNFFTDDEGHWAEAAMNRLAAAGILRGCGPALACPTEPVTRGQFAALVKRAFDMPASDTDFFIDDETSVFEGDINSIAAIGITRGCDDTGENYCPTHAVLRDQAATLLARTVQWWESN